MNILFPMGGRGSRLGYYSSNPKPLIKILGKTILEWSVQSLNLDGNYIFCINKKHDEEFKISEQLKKIKPDCKVISIEYQTQGALETILHARKFIDNNEDFLVALDSLVISLLSTIIPAYRSSIIQPIQTIKKE